MAFGKRTIDKSPLRATSPGTRYRPLTAPGHKTASNDDRSTASQLGTLVVISVGGAVALAAMTAVVVPLLQSQRNETVQIDASLVDGSQAPAALANRLINACVELGVMSGTRGAATSDEDHRRASATCQCTFGQLAHELSPLQVQMLYVDQRTKLRALLADIDRTGERITVGALPKIEMRDHAPVAVVSTAFYAAQWRQAQSLAAQSASCSSQ